MSTVDGPQRPNAGDDPKRPDRRRNQRAAPRDRQQRHAPRDRSLGGDHTRAAHDDDPGEDR